MELSYTSNLSHVPTAWGNIPNPCPASVSGTTFLIIAYSAVSAVGLLGNSCLVYVIARQKEMRNVTNVLIANLSCSDILMCIVCLPATIIYTLMDHWILGEALCKVTPFVQCTSITVSIFSLVLIAMERYQLIIHPTGWKPAVSQSYQAVGVTWLLAFLISLPFLSVLVLDSPFQDMALPFQNLSVPFQNLSVPFQNLSVPFHNLTISFGSVVDHLVCVEQWSSNDNRLAYFTSLLLFQYLLPLVLILVCYLRIFLRLKQRNDMVERSGSDSQQKKAKGSRRINAMLGSIVVVFALCWLPLNVFNTVFDWYHEAVKSCQHDVIFSACHLTAMASTCVNPIIYGFLNSNFQKQLKATLLRCRCWGAGERYESFPLSILSTEVTKGSLLSKGSISINT